MNQRPSRCTQFGWAYTGDILKHAILPALSLLIVTPIGWIWSWWNVRSASARRNAASASSFSRRPEG